MDARAAANAWKDAPVGPARDVLFTRAWGDLSTYNAQVSQGLVHTPEWVARMARRQALYDQWQRCGWTLPADPDTLEADADAWSAAHPVTPPRVVQRRHSSPGTRTDRTRVQEDPVMQRRTRAQVRQADAETLAAAGALVAEWDGPGSGARVPWETVRKVIEQLLSIIEQAGDR